jgi:SAM-dependent methyltransferase
MIPPFSPQELLSHAFFQQGLYEERLKEVELKITARGDLPYASVEKQLQILKELTSFELGRSLIENQGLNAYYIDYVIKHPQGRKEKNLDLNEQPFSELESFMLNQAPVALATQERFVIFQEQLQKRLCEGMEMVSSPCGVMSDLLTLDFTGISNFHLRGIDLDPQSIELAENQAKLCQLDQQCSFDQLNAWDLSLEKPVDIITSNGLNIYEPDDEKVTALYQVFYDNLKEGGCLITSFLTPPPQLDPSSSWDMSQVHLQDLMLQKLILSDIIGVKWQTFRTLEETQKQLHKVGFTNLEFIPCRAGIFPTVVAYKGDQ